jgi:pimeloyl-ACP methyl ester carboxylesterase
VPERTVVVALPGLGLGPESWRPTLERLRPGVDASVRTFAGFGEPARRGVDLDPRALARAVCEDLPEVGRPIVLLAHSASSQVAAHVAVLAPERIAALVLVGPTTDPRAASWPGLVRRWLATALRETPSQVPQLLRQWGRTGLMSMARALDAARRDDVLSTLEPVSVPVLVVRGPHDRVCPADWSEAVAQRGGAGSRAVTLSQGAHMVPCTHGELVAALVNELLDALPPGESPSSPPLGATDWVG